MPWKAEWNRLPLLTRKYLMALFYLRPEDRDKNVRYAAGILVGLFSVKHETALRVAREAYDNCLAVLETDKDCENVIADWSGVVGRSFQNRSPQ